MISSGPSRNRSSHTSSSPAEAPPVQAPRSSVAAWARTRPGGAKCARQGRRPDGAPAAAPPASSSAQKGTGAESLRNGPGRQNLPRVCAAPPHVQAALLQARTTPPRWNHAPPTGRRRAAHQHAPAPTRCPAFFHRRNIHQANAWCNRRCGLSPIPLTLGRLRPACAGPGRLPGPAPPPPGPGRRRGPTGWRRARGWAAGLPSSQ